MRICLVAHDNMKRGLIEWAKFNALSLVQHDLYSTKSTGEVLNKECNLSVNHLLSGPAGGDQQIGAMIAEGKIDMLIFFPDPMTPQPHDTDVKALSRIAQLYNIPLAENRSTADFLISSSLFEKHNQVFYNSSGK